MMNLILYMHDLDEAIAAAALAAIPRYLPTPPLVYYLEQGIERREAEDPAAWIVAQTPSVVEPAWLSNAQEGALVSMSTSLIPPISVVGREQLFETCISFPERSEYLAGVPALLRTLGPAMRAHWGDSTPGDAVLAIIRGAGNKLPLPSVDPLTVDMHPRRPSSPGWVNYWSYETCEAYREVIYDVLGEGRDRSMSGVAQYERYRLLCIARREPAMRAALVQLYEHADEWSMVRFAAAVEAIDEGYDTRGPERALREVGQGESSIAMAARGVVRALEERARSGE